MAAPAPSVTIVSPKNGSVLSGSGVEISVAFIGTSALPVTRVQISLDGKKVTEQTDLSRVSGECGFLWDTMRTEDGQHRLEAEVYSGRTYLGGAVSVVRVANKTQLPDDPDLDAETPARDIKPPQAKIQSPAEGETVSGKVPVIIQARDDSGRSPYVSVFVDKSLKAVTNHEPYMYAWDSTEAENGPHEIHLSVMDDAENRTVTPPVRIIVRNPMKNSSAVTERPVSLPDANTDVTPRGLPSPDTEAARSDSAAGEKLEFTQSKPREKAAASRVEVVATPSESVQVARVPEPEVHVLVSGPAEYRAAALPVPVETPVEAVAAATDQPRTKDWTSRPAVKSFRRHTVQPGEALWTIARRYGTTVEELVEENSIKDPSLIRIGAVLLIPTQATMVTLRSALDSVGGGMSWDAGTRSVYAWMVGAEIRLRIDSARVDINDQHVIMDRAATLRSGRTMVPRSFVTETLGIPSTK